MLTSHPQIRRRRLAVTQTLVLVLLAVALLQSPWDVSAEQDASTFAGTGAQSAPVGTLEVPPPDSNQSGIGVITGWVCDAERIALRVDGQEVEAAYGTRRSDTQGVCGDSNNGFGYLINWNVLGDGPHRIEALADGVPIGASDITVSTLGDPFRRGLSGTYDLLDFPTTGSSTTVQWVESAQGFRIVPPRQDNAASTEAVSQAVVVGVLENPQDGPVSGIGVVSGWVCDAEEVFVYVDGALRMAAAYGTSRGDTVGVCGDSNNGFGGLINWNLLGDGSHIVRVEADGELVGESNVIVQTLGAPFVQGLSGTFGLGLFGGRHVRLEWQEAQQNFVIDTSAPDPHARPDTVPDASANGHRGPRRTDSDATTHPATHAASDTKANADVHGDTEADPETDAKAYPAGLLQDLHNRQGVRGYLHLTEQHVPRRRWMCVQRVDRSAVPARESD